MNWIQYFNETLFFLSRFWNELNLCEEVLIIWLIGVFVYNLGIPSFKYLCFLLSRSKKHKTIDSYCNRDLKPCCIFLDHAAGAYVLSESTIEIEEEKQFSLCEKVLTEIPNSEINKYYDYSTNVCYGVSFFSHNRLQSIEADEAHWFILNLYRTDDITRSVLREKIKQSKGKNYKLNQAVDINSIYPFVTSAHFAINIYYQHMGDYYILLSETDRFFFDIELTPELYDGTNNFASKVTSIFDEMIKDEGFEQLLEVNLTDIGFDTKNMQLIIIGRVCIGYSNKLRHRRHLKLGNSAKLSALVDNEDDYKSLFAYSCINLRTYIKKSQK